MSEEEGNLNRMQEIQLREPSADTELSTIQRESKPKVQKTLICSKSREGTAESSGATRFSNTSVNFQQIIVTNARNGTYSKQT